MAVVVAMAMLGGPAAAAEPGASAPRLSMAGRATPGTSPRATPVEAEPSPSPRTRVPGDRMVQAGVGIVVAGLAGYGLMAAGLGIGNRAEGDLLPLAERADLSARREVLARGQLGNRLAIAGAVTATVAMAVGIPLIVLGRRRHEAASPRAVVRVGGTGGGFGLQLRGRF